MAVSRILLKTGTVLQHVENDHVQALRDMDILIVDDRIAQIGPGIPSDGSELVIDCRDKIISPGFVNAHHHLWQTQLKGRFADLTLLDYIVEGKQRTLGSSTGQELNGCIQRQETSRAPIIPQKTHSGASWVAAWRP